MSEGSFSEVAANKGCVSIRRAKGPLVNGRD